MTSKRLSSKTKKVNPSWPSPKLDTTYSLRTKTVIDRTYRLADVNRTKAGVFLVLKSPHDTLRISLDESETLALSGHVGETVKLTLAPSRPSSVPPRDASKVKG